MTKARPNKPAKAKSARTPKATKQPRKAKPEKNSTTARSTPTSSSRDSKLTKTSQCLALLRRNEGASLDELKTVTGWQSHSVRGFLSGAVKRKLGLTITSAVGPDGIRRYRVAKDEA